MKEDVTIWRGEPTITVRQLLPDGGLRLGLPHFQRGLVWGTGAMSALMESLFFDTPCGSFVFWKSKQPGEDGVPLDDSDDEAARRELDYLVVDGQQRIRSIRSAFHRSTHGRRRG